MAVCKECERYNLCLVHCSESVLRNRGICEHFKNGWISVKVDLPKDRQRVLIYDGNANQWNPSTHSAVFVKGRTKEEIMDEYRRTCRLYYTFGDEEGNNKKPYRWRGDGHMEWFGQTVTHWMPLPEDPKEE